jgi:hypothetical protein
MHTTPSTARARRSTEETSSGYNSCPRTTQQKFQGELCVILCCRECIVENACDHAVGLVVRTYGPRVSDSGIVSTRCTLSYIPLFCWDRKKVSSLSFILRFRLSSSRRTPWYIVCGGRISTRSTKRGGVVRTSCSCCCR